MLTIEAITNYKFNPQVHYPAPGVINNLQPLFPPGLNSQAHIPVVIRVPKVTGWMDYENLVIGLDQIGLPSTTEEIIAMIRTKLFPDECMECTLTAHANWQKLKRFGGMQLPNKLEALGVNAPVAAGDQKNSSDMKISKEIYELLWKLPPGSLPNTILLATCDGDFADCLHEAKKLGVQVMLIAIEGKTSQTLISIADQVFFIDREIAQSKTSLYKQLKAWAVNRVAHCLIFKDWNFVTTSYLHQGMHREALQNSNVNITMQESKALLEELAEIGVLKKDRQGTHTIWYIPELPGGDENYMLRWIVTAYDQHLQKTGMKGIPLSQSYKAVPSPRAKKVFNLVVDKLLAKGIAYKGVIHPSAGRAFTVLTLQEGIQLINSIREERQQLIQNSKFDIQANISEQASASMWSDIFKSLGIIYPLAIKLTDQ